MLSEHTILQQGTPAIRQTIAEQAMQAGMRPFGSKLQLSGCLQAKGRQVSEAPEIIRIVLKEDALPVLRQHTNRHRLPRCQRAGYRQLADRLKGHRSTPHRYWMATQLR